MKIESTQFLFIDIHDMVKNFLLMHYFIIIKLENQLFY